MNVRTSRGCIVTVSCLALLLTSGASPVGTQGNNKSIFVSVLDADGNPVTGMTAADFAIREDNVDRKIVDVKPASQPIYVARVSPVSPGRS